MSAQSPMPSAAPESPAETRVLSDPTWVYWMCLVSTATWYWLMFRARYEGVANIPQRGRVVILANHQSFLDIPMISTGARKRHVSFVARDSLARSKFMAFIMRGCGAVLIRRGHPDRAALREMLAHLEAEDALVIFPEGTRSPDGRVQAFHGGALLAARLANAPIIPAGIRGTFEAWPKGARFPRFRRVAVRFGAPIDSASPDALELAHAAIDAMVGDGRFAAVPPSA